MYTLYVTVKLLIQATTLFLYPLKTSENLSDFLMLLGHVKDKNGKKWVNMMEYLQHTDLTDKRKYKYIYCFVQRSKMHIHSEFITLYLQHNDLTNKRKYKHIYCFVQRSKMHIHSEFITL